MSDASSTARGRKIAKAEAARARSRQVVAIPIDSVADAAIAARAFDQPPTPRCEVCEGAVDADSTRGLLVWARGDERRYEEPQICDRCSTILGMSALAQWTREDDEE